MRPQEASKKLTGKLLPPELSRASVFKEMATHLTQQLWEETVHVSAFDAMDNLAALNEQGPLK